MLTIKSITADPYARTIEAFLAQCFPSSVDSSEAMIDALTSAFLSTSQNRYGPLPRPESIVAIRDVLRYWTLLDMPIAVLSPWGSRKVGDGLLDVAEIMALRQLEALNNRVKRYYSPGIAVNVGIEDLGGHYMWAEEEGWIPSGTRYVHGMADLVSILEMGKFIDVVKESDLALPKAFNTAADEFFEPLIEHLNTASETALRKMRQLGWVGTLPNEMVGWYMNQYDSMYPNRSTEFKLTMLARYLAQSAARYKVGAKMRHKWWEKNFVQINFPQPVPGLPEAMGSRRLHYRTLPMRMARTHMPPWRAKGFLCIRGDDAQVKLATMREEREYTRLTLEIKNETRSVKASADYVLAD